MLLIKRNIIMPYLILECHFAVEYDQHATSTLPFRPLDSDSSFLTAATATFRYSENIDRLLWMRDCPLLNCCHSFPTWNIH